MTTQKLKNAQQHNEREKDSYVNPDIVPERSHLNVHFKKPDGSYLEQFERMEAASVISTRGLKEDAFRYGELVFDVNSAYFFNRGGYEFAKEFYEAAYQAAIKIVGGEQYILSAVMHADERNRAMSDALGQDVYHYHLHVVYVPVVEKQILWTKRCKDISARNWLKQNRYTAVLTGTGMYRLSGTLKRHFSAIPAWRRDTVSCIRTVTRAGAPKRPLSGTTCSLHRIAKLKRISPASARKWWMILLRRPGPTLLGKRRPSSGRFCRTDLRLWKVRPASALRTMTKSWEGIGRPIELREDSRGLYLKAKISDTSMGKDIKVLLRDGVLNELSIGYDPVVFDYDENGIRHLREVKLWEVSIVTWAMNPLATITDYKAADTAQGAAQIVREAEREVKEGRKISGARLKTLKDALETMKGAASALEALIGEAENNGEKQSDKSRGTKGAAAKNIIEIVL